MSAQGRRNKRTVERERVAWPAAEANCNGSNGGGGDIGKRGSDNNRTMHRLMMATHRIEKP